MSQDNHDELPEEVFKNACSYIQKVTPKKQIQSSHDLFQYLHNRRGMLQNITTQTNKDGYTLLQVAALANRVNMVQVLFDLDIFIQMVKRRVEIEGSQYKGMTVIDMMVKLQLVKMQDELHRLNEVEDSMSELHTAAREADLTNVRFLTSSNTSLIDKIACDNTTPLYWAVTCGSVDVIKVLVSAGADVNVINYEGYTLLVRAVSLGHHHLIPYLVETCKIDPDIAGEGAKTALHVAIENKDIHSLGELVKIDANIPQSVVNTLAQSGSMKLIEFVQTRFQLNWNEQDMKGKYPLFLAAERGFSEVVEFLLKLNVNIMAKDRKFRTAIHAVVEGGDEKSLALLLQVANQHKCLDHILNARDKYTGSERCFLVRGRDKGTLAFHYVNVDRMLIDVFRQITRAGGSLDVAQYGSMILSGWGAQPAPEIVDEVDEKYNTSKIDSSSPDDMTPLHVAILKEKEQCALDLIAAGCDVNIKDCFGLRPLHMAGMRGMLSVVIKLMEHGADTNAKDEKGRTPIDAAQSNKHINVAKYLQAGVQLAEQQQSIIVSIACEMYLHTKCISLSHD